MYQGYAPVAKVCSIGDVVSVYTTDASQTHRNLTIYFNIQSDD